MAKNKHWRSLQSPPIPQAYEDIDGVDMVDIFTNLIKLDSTHFVLFSRGIIEYDIITNKWKKWIIDDPAKISEDGPHSHSSICYNPVTKQIFILETENIAICDVQQKQLKQYPSKAIKCTTTTQCFCIDSVCHVIGRFVDESEQESHYIWNDEAKQLQHNYTFDDRPGLHHFSLIHLKKRKELVILGGFDCDSFSRDTIYVYSLLSKEWKKLDIKMPRKMFGFGYVITKDERYVIIMGGNKENMQLTDAIYILDLRVMKFCKCKIRLPFEGCCRAVIMGNETKNDLLVHGFVKNEMNKYRMNIPFALISLIAIWHLTEYIYVVDYEYGTHWKVSVDEIFQQKN